MKIIHSLKSSHAYHSLDGEVPPLDEVGSYVHRTDARAEHVNVVPRHARQKPLVDVFIALTIRLVKSDKKTKSTENEIM
jgi:hypothetical protein